MLSIADATDTVLKDITPLGSQSLQDISAARGYILAQDVLAKEPLPPFPASIKALYHPQYLSRRSVFRSHRVKVAVTWGAGWLCSGGS